MKEPSRTIGVTLLVGVFVVFGTGVLLDLAARALPTRAEQVGIVGRDTHETIMPDLATRSRTFLSTHRIILEGEGGARFVIDAPRELHGRALSGLMTARGATVNLRRSVLFGRPVGLEVTEPPLIDLDELPALRQLLGEPGDNSRTRVAAYSLHVPPVLSAGWLALLGIMAWLMIILPHKERFIWPVFGSGMVVSVALGTWWWAG